MSGAILVTGGTGVLGRELVPRLLTERREVFVLTRDPHGAAASALRRACAPRGEHRLRLVRGDVVAPGLGLAPSDERVLREQVTHVLHGAAATTFSLPLDEARSVNVHGTRSVIALARACPRLEALACASTAYVAGTRAGTILENDTAAPGWVNSYEQSKHEMEAIARDAMATLPLSLVRFSTIIGSADTGVVSGYNAIHQALRLLYHGLAPMLPGSLSSPADLIPVEYAAAAAHGLLLERFTPGRTYHVCAGAAGSCTADELLTETMAVFERTRPTWRKRRIARPAGVDPDTYALFTRSVAESGNTVLQAATAAVGSFAWQLAYPKTFDTTGTRAALDGLGIGAPHVLDYFARVVTYCVETNWGRLDAGAAA